MYGKILGSVLIMLCGIAFAYGMKRKYALKVEVLKGISRAIDLIHAEIKCMRTPTEDLLDKLCYLNNRELNNFFAKCNEMHKNHRDLPFFDVWQKVLSDNMQLGLRHNEVDAFNDIGNCLGRYDADEQLRILINSRSCFEGYLEIAEEEKEKMGRLYGNLSILSCVVLVIILL